MNDIFVSSSNWSAVENYLDRECVDYSTYDSSGGVMVTTDSDTVDKIEQLVTGY